MNQQVYCILLEDELVVWFCLVKSVLDSSKTEPRLIMVQEDYIFFLFEGVLASLLS